MCLGHFVVIGHFCFNYVPSFKQNFVAFFIVQFITKPTDSLLAAYLLNLLHYSLFTLHVHAILWTCLQWQN